MINNIKNNTTSEADAKKKINKLNETKKVETKGKRLINEQKILLNLFDDLVKAILNNSSNNNDNSNNSNNNSNNSNNNESDSENESVNENENENENESDDEQYYKIEQINNNFKKIDETKSFKDQIDVLKEIPDLDDY